MYSEHESDLHSDNVVSLNEQRRLRQQREVEAELQPEVAESVSEVRCEGGVCALAWSPKKKSAA
jgi:hypothetical protein